MFESEEVMQDRLMRCVEWNLAQGKSPSIRQLMKCSGYQSQKPVVFMLRKLDKEGYIKYNPIKGYRGTTGISLTAKRYEYPERGVQQKDSIF